MKTIAKFTACLALVCAVSVAFAQQSGTTKQSKKEKTTKKVKAIDNKIAVSDQIQTSDKSGRANTKKDNGISNR
jgi:hypothetical protein